MSSARKISAEVLQTPQSDVIDASWIWETESIKAISAQSSNVSLPKNPSHEQNNSKSWNDLQKAAPRFELGIKDLQSSALPLGHAAGRELSFPKKDRISRDGASLLVLSNGHGEDLIALRVLEQLRTHHPRPRLEVLPLVGIGSVFEPATQAGWLTRIGPKATLPSGGFSNQSLRGLIADIGAGLPLMSWRQWRLVRQRAKRGATVLAVGDLLPLLMAWGSGARYGFIGTPKSDYTWRSGPGRQLSDSYHRCKGSEWDPWEWMLMRHQRCRLVAMRDGLTARGLKRRGVAALAAGNPMMDGLKTASPPASLQRCRRILLLCGSRMPEACRNLERLLAAITPLSNSTPLAVLVALGNQPSMEQTEPILRELGFRRGLPPSDQLGAEACWVRGPLLVILGRNQFTQWAGWAEVGLATAGTATEQLVGLGIPALSLPGPGPQFHAPFALRQARLLGGAVRPCSSGEELREHLRTLLTTPELCQKLSAIGRSRMGRPGGGARLAELVLERLHGY